jgi:hypothetical protein
MDSDNPSGADNQQERPSFSSESYILEVLRDWESSEAIRRAPPVKLGG